MSNISILLIILPLSILHDRGSMISSIPVVSILYAASEYGYIFKAPDLLASFLTNKKDEKISRLITEHGLPKHTHTLEFGKPSLAGAMGTCFKEPNHYIFKSFLKNLKRGLKMLSFSMKLVI